MNGRNVSWVDKKTTHTFMSPKLTRGWGLPIHRADESIKVWFTKGETYEAKEVAMHVTF